MKRKVIYINSDNRKMKVIMLSPTNNKLNPGILWIHGGGYYEGMASMIYFSKGSSIAKKFNAVVLSPEYRKSKQEPYPAAFNDCVSTLKYMYNNAEKLGIDKNKIILGGESAGGGLAIALSLYARDNNIPIMLQIPLYPMIDCFDTPSSKNNHGYNWNTKKNHKAWKLYLGKLYYEKDIPKYASPSREKDYSNLPPCYTFVQDNEPFYCETLKYIRDLRKFNVDANIDIYHGKMHAFDILFWTKKAKTAKKRMFKKIEKYFILED